MKHHNGDITDEQRRRLTEALKQSPSFTLAYEDPDFMAEDVLRSMRLGLELNKAELLLRRHQIRSSIAVFGSARTQPPEEAEARLASLKKKHKGTTSGEATTALRLAEKQVDQSRYYAEARKFSQIVSKDFIDDNAVDLVIFTGGGPGIMEASNRGAFDVSAPSCGLNITIPMEQQPNPYITPELCFQFHYFAIRKMHFLMRAMALVAFPGGFGTMDELFEALTLVQTRKMQRIPVVLVGSDFWHRAINFDFLVEEGVISPGDLDLFSIVDTAEKAVAVIYDYYGRSIPKPGEFY